MEKKRSKLRAFLGISSFALLSTIKGWGRILLDLTSDIESIRSLWRFLDSAMTSSLPLWLAPTTGLLILIWTFWPSIRERFAQVFGHVYKETPESISAQQIAERYMQMQKEKESPATSNALEEYLSGKDHEVTVVGRPDHRYTEKTLYDFISIAQNPLMSLDHVDVLTKPSIGMRVWWKARVMDVVPQGDTVTVLLYTNRNYLVHAMFKDRVSLPLEVQIELDGVIQSVNRTWLGLDSCYLRSS